MSQPDLDPWRDAVLAAELLGVDPAGLGGIRARARAGPVREAWLKLVTGLMPEASNIRRVAASPDEESLVGGLDFSATLATGRPVMRSGLLASVNGGMLVLSMAERTTLDCAALIASALDRGAVRVERAGFSGDLEARFILIALDEGIDDDEILPPILADRLGLTIALEGVSHRALGSCRVDHALIAAARARLAEVTVGDDMLQALVGLALAGGWDSARGARFMLRVARAAAALRGALAVEVEDAATAGRLVLGAERLAAAREASRQAPPAEPPPDDPASAEASPAPQPDAPPSDETKQGADALNDLVLEAAVASLPDGVLDQLFDRQAAARSGTNAGGAGATVKDGRRGRPLAPLARPNGSQARLDLLATLRTAAPWQRLRERQPGDSVRVRAADFRYKRHAERRGVTAIFAVDASGSAAVARLAEAKGAVQMLLADCYVRRDEVALIAYRKADAEILLEPTRSLVRAKRALSGLPGGGGTPLAAGILAAAKLARALERRGRDAISIFLTDGRANVALDGAGGRERAMADVRETARRFRAMGLGGIVIDTGARPQSSVAELASELGAEYVVLPRGGAGRISAALSERMRS